MSAPIVGFDLVRHPRGRAIADILLWGLSLRPGDLAAVGAARMPTADRDRAWAEVRAIQQNLGRGVLSGSALASASDAQPASSLGGMIESLRGSLIMDLDDLEHLIRSDILDPGNFPGYTADAAHSSAAATAAHSSAAADVLLDAVVGEWVDGLSASTRSQLVRPYHQIRDNLRVHAGDVGPCAAEVEAVLDPLRQLDPDGCARVRLVNELLGSRGSSWAEAVHQASWAALTTGRIRAAAAAQLLTVRAFLDGGLDAADGAEGVWNMISGHVHACVVFDVLPNHTQQLLGRGWRSALPAA